PPEDARVSRHLWSRTVLDLTPWQWRRRSGNAKRSNQLLETSVLQARRDPALSESQNNDYGAFSDRITRCAAFGQDTQAVRPNEQKIAQLGLYGTGAAFQLLSRGSSANAMRANSALDADASEWLDAYLRCLNFIDLVVCPPGPEPEGEIWNQRRLTL